MGILSNILGNAGVVDSEKLTSEYGALLIENESIEVGFNIFRDKFIFTNKRLIIVDVQGLTGSKIEYLTVPILKSQSIA